MDDRFKKMETDPRFRTIKKKRQKVEVDDRFKEMFTGDKFKSEYRIDKRGKPIHETNEQNMKKFYRLKDDKKKKKKNKTTKKANEQLEKSEEIIETADFSEETPETVETTEKEVEVESAPEDDVTVQDDDESSNSDESSSDEEEVDLMRGYGNVESSDFSDDDEMYDDETPAQVFDHNWNELDKEAPTDENISKRMALCNMDWDRIKAEDIFMLFHSFKPKQAAGIKKVSIYISEFGKERLKEEELKGPKEISESNPKDLEDVDEKEGEKFHVENLRQYQINRLKYYYAVIECDCNETANEIYMSCDGMEFETSASKLDLRFIPDDMEFDDEPTQVCTEMPDKDLYQPTRFVTTALNQSKVDLTWDETDKRRVTVMTRRFKEEEIEEMDLNEFLASSSGEEESDEEEEIEGEVTRSRPLACVSRTSTADQIERYRAMLLGEMDEEEKKDDDDDDVHMEFTWNPDDLEDKKSSPTSDDEEEGNKEEEFFADSEENSSEESDDSESEKPKKKKKKVKFSAGAGKEEEEESEESKKEKAQLAMLMMDDQGEGEQKHFNMNKIVKSFNEKNKKKKRKNKKKQADEDDEDNFQIDLNDDRFSSVFTSSEYAIDPNAPAFKKTPAMMQVVEERRKRRVESTTTGEKKPKASTNNIELDDSEISSVTLQQKTNNLVSMITKSTKNMKTQKPKTQKSSLAENPFISGILKKPTAPEKNGDDDEMTITQSKAETKPEVEKKTKKEKKKNSTESKEKDEVADLVASIRAKQATKRANSFNQAAAEVAKMKKSKK